jgi:CDP-paratose 2-epimerase
MPTILVTGSSGLIGSQTCRFFGKEGYKVIGIDNDMRSYFFGEEASTHPTLKELQLEPDINYCHHNVDIRNRESVEDIFKQNSFDIIIHTAAQPSHDWAAQEPVTDHGVNNTATLYLLECLRNHCPEATFIFTSTNKVYGDTPNLLPLEEKETRWEIPKDHKFYNGIDESMSVDNSTHSIFGVNKLAADLMVQEYGKYFKLNTTCFRGGCLTGRSHAGAELHGFLSYLIKAAKEDIPYTVFGYKGKQVRDNIHSSDLVKAFWEVHKKPRQGEVYNIGGSRHSCISMIEAIDFISDYLNKKIDFSISKENRKGDHIWYISDVSKFKKDYPAWDYSHNIEDILKEMLER